MGYKMMAMSKTLRELIDWLKTEVVELEGTLTGTHDDTTINEMGDVLNCLMAIGEKLGWNILDIYAQAQKKSLIHGSETYTPIKYDILKPEYNIMGGQSGNRR